MPLPTTRPVRRRPVLVTVLVGVVAAGLLVTALGGGALADLGRAALYALAVLLVLALAAPRATTAGLAVTALGTCLAVELAQLGPVPGLLVEAVPPLRYLLGSTFHAPDLPGYALGVAAGAVVDHRRGRAAAARTVPLGAILRAPGSRESRPAGA